MDAVLRPPFDAQRAAEEMRLPDGIIEYHPDDDPALVHAAAEHAAGVGACRCDLNLAKCRWGGQCAQDIARYEAARWEDYGRRWAEMQSGRRMMIAPMMIAPQLTPEEMRELASTPGSIDLIRGMMKA